MQTLGARGGEVMVEVEREGSRLALPLQHGMPGDDGFSVARYWMEIDDGRCLGVFVLTMTMLFAPKILGYIATVSDPQLRRGCGGAGRGLVSLLIENVLAAVAASAGPTIAVGCTLPY